MDTSRKNSNNLTHIDADGNAVMVDVSGKEATSRTAVASGTISMNAAAFDAVQKGTAKKGDVLGVARVAAIMAVKKTWDLIPLCHPLPVSKCSVAFESDASSLLIKVFCTVGTTGPTGVEMEALTGASCALLTIYDMLKAVDKSMEIGSLHLESKTGGQSGDYIRGGQA